jgi:hypothetical protein
LQLESLNNEAKEELRLQTVEQSNRIVQLETLIQIILRSLAPQDSSNGVSSSPIAVTPDSSTSSPSKKRKPYSELCLKSKQRRCSETKTLIIDNGLASSDEDCNQLLLQIIPTNLSRIIEEDVQIQSFFDDETRGALSRMKCYISQHHKCIALGALRECVSNADIDKAINELQSLSNNNYAGLTTRRFKTWRKNSKKMKRKPGPKVNVEFESDVWAKLILCAYVATTTDSTAINETTPTARTAAPKLVTGCLAALGEKLLKDNSRLVVADDPPAKKVARILYNVAYDREIIKSAAIETSLEEKWRNTIDLRFSDS